MSSKGESPAVGPEPGRASGQLLPEGFHFGVATAGFQVEGGFNGPDQPANNWLAWEHVGRVEPSGRAVDFWARPDESLDRAAALGCTSFRLGVEWARVIPDERGVDGQALAGYVDIVRRCLDRGLEPLVTLHHFTHPAWLGEDFWLRPDAPERYRRWVEVAAGALAPLVRHWVTLNEINVLALGSWMLGMFPPGRNLSFDDAALAVDNLLCAHVLGYEVIHGQRPDAVVTTNNACTSIYEYDRLLTDVLLARSSGVERSDVGEWLDVRRRQHDSLLPPGGVAERMLRRLARSRSPYPPGGGDRDLSVGRGSPPLPRRALDVVYESHHPRTLDVLGLDYYDPMAGRHFRMPGHWTAGSRNWMPTRALWDDIVDPGGLTRWLGIQHALAPGLPLWVVENGLCNRVLDGRSLTRGDHWDRPRYLRENLAAVLDAIDQGVPVTGYWHWSLVDNYEWGSYQPRFGLYGIDRGEHGVRWRDTDAAGMDSAGAYRRIIAGLRAGDRSVVDPPPGPSPRA